jgi:hypothetical protein
MQDLGAEGWAAWQEEVTSLCELQGQAADYFDGGSGLCLKDIVAPAMAYFDRLFGALQSTQPQFGMIGLGGNSPARPPPGRDLLEMKSLLVLAVDDEPHN